MKFFEWGVHFDDRIIFSIKNQNAIRTMITAIEKSVS